MGEFQGYTVPAPTGGLNLIDRIDAMPENDAREISNFYSDGQKVQTRFGYSKWTASPAATAVRTLCSVTEFTGNAVFLGAANNKWYNLDAGTFVDVTGTTTPTNDRWNTTIFSGILYACNGQDTAQYFDGSTFADLTFTGVALDELISVSSYKRRLYFCRVDSTEVWYGDTSVTGTTLTPALTKFDPGEYFRNGGYVVFSGSFTDRLSSTSTDLFMICSSEGELLFYSGSHPGDSAWALVAHFIIGRPMGYRSFIRVDNDVWIITERGIVPVSMLFNGGADLALNSVGRKINKFVNDYASRLGENHIWHGVFWPRGRRVFVVVPTSATDTSVLVCNIDTGAWFLYEYETEGIVLTLAEHEGLPYSGTSGGYVMTHEVGVGYPVGYSVQSDDGGPIVSSFKGAYSFYGSRGNYKSFKDIRPLMYTKRGVTLSVGVDTDFRSSSAVSTVTVTSGKTTPTGSPTGTLPGADYEYLFDRYSLKGQGHSAALKIETSLTDVSIDFSAFEVRFEKGSQV